MALLEKQLYIKKSTIPNAGKGLFTKKPIAKGTRIVEYKGKISSWKDVKDEDGKNAYIFYVKRYHVINAMHVLTSWARYANDANGLTKIKGITNNCEYETDGLRAFMIAKRNLPARCEIFVDYGRDYWKVIRENLKLWAKEAKEAKEKEAKAKAKKSGKAAKKVKKAKR